MNDFPDRKHPRLKDYDYREGAHFVTICSDRRKCLFSQIVVGRGLAPAEIRLSPIGVILSEELVNLEKRYENIKVDSYVIMPNHIHLILLIEAAAGASPRPTLMDIICAYKSLATGRCKKLCHLGKVFQTSFYEHIIRSDEDCRKIREYIENNPARWSKDPYFEHSPAVQNKTM